LVVGATGTVGTELVKQLNEGGHNVVALARDPERAEKLGDVEVVIGDLEQPETLGSAFEGADKAFVLAPPVPNIETIEANAFDAAKAAGVSHLVYLSNFGAEAFGVDLWKAHEMSERRVRALGPEWTILRPTRFMSNTPYAFVSVVEDGVIAEPTGGRLSPLVDPRDIAGVAAAALTEEGHEGEVYELTSESLTGEEIAAVLGKVLGKEVRFEDASDDVAKEWLIKAGFPAEIAEKVLFFFETLRADRWYGTKTVEHILGEARSFERWATDHAEMLETAAEGLVRAK
jgi:uncharacterized protein YbjT (DUF2867 family)